MICKGKYIALGGAGNDDLIANYISKDTATIWLPTTKSYIQHSYKTYTCLRQPWRCAKYSTHKLEQ